MMRLRQIMFVAASALLVFSCQSASDKLKFDKGRWTEFDDSDGGEYHYRNKMLSDLVSNHKLKGLTYEQLVDSLGAPTYSESSNGTVSYEITNGFDSDIDPTHGKNLDLFLGADSTVISYKISEWKHE